MGTNFLEIAQLRGQWILLASGILGFFGVFLVVRAVLMEQEARAAQENLAELRDRKSSNFLIKLTRPIFSQYIFPMVKGRPYWDRYRPDYKQKIVMAGLKDELTPDEFIAFRLCLVFVMPVFLFFMSIVGDLGVDPLYLVGAAGLGWQYPMIMLGSLKDARQKAVLRSMPFIVDLLALSTEAGLDFVGAIGKVVEKARPGPMVEELGQMLKEIKVGSSRQVALRDMSLRIGMREINSFVAILISAEQMGASIGGILRQQSEQIRMERMVRAEKAGAKASQAVLLPTMLFMVPAVFLLIIGPLALSGAL
jgi:tight adherence protein C